MRLTELSSGGSSQAVQYLFPASVLNVAASLHGERVLLQLVLVDGSVHRLAFAFVTSMVRMAWIARDSACLRPGSAGRDVG
jgi:hypothetical protein